MGSNCNRTDVQILRWIESLDRGEIDIAVPAMAKRYRQLYPDTEMVVATIPKYNKVERVAFYEALLDYIRNYEEPRP